MGGNGLVPVLVQMQDRNPGIYACGNKGMMCEDGMIYWGFLEFYLSLYD